MVSRTRRLALAVSLFVDDFESFIFTADPYTRYGHVLQTSLISGLIGFICSPVAMQDILHFTSTSERSVFSAMT